MVEEYAKFINWKNTAEQTNYPFCGKHLYLNIMGDKVSRESGEVNLDKVPDDMAMFVESWEVTHIIITELVVLNKFNKHNECNLIWSMVEHEPCNEIHTLHIPYILIPHCW